MVLNELSLQNPVNDERIARELMSKLIETINLAVKKGKCLNKINYIFFSKIVKHFFEIIQ
jgi:hypothetical protein